MFPRATLNRLRSQNLKDTKLGMAPLKLSKDSSTAPCTPVAHCVHAPSFSHQGSGPAVPSGPERHEIGHGPLETIERLLHSALHACRALCACTLILAPGFGSR